MTKWWAHLILGGLFFIPACKQANITQQPNKAIYKDYEARFAELPSIIDFIPIYSNETNSQFILAGISHIPFHEVIEFYMHEMERLGWKLTIAFDDRGIHKSIFQKPKKVCLIELAVHENKWMPSTASITISLGSSTA